jgi:uncharacterized protein (DUF58 family)
VSGEASPRLRSAAAACAILLLAALALRRAELVAVAAPLGLIVVAGCARLRAPAVTASLRLTPLRTVEDAEVELEIELRSETGVPTLELVLSAPRGMAPVEERPVRRLELAAGERRTLHQRYRCLHWGGYALGLEAVTARDRFGLFTYRLPVPARVPLRVYPNVAPAHTRTTPRTPQLSVGGDVARIKGEGIEYADVRPYTHGDRVRRVNWRLTARRGRPYVNEHHPERNADVVLFVDSFGEDGGWAEGPLDEAVRAATAITHVYLEHRDRVGVVGFGGVLRWVLPGSGAVQSYRILDSLIDTRIVASAAWRGVEVIPARTLPAGALVLALTPLVDERTLAALANLRARGFDLAVVEISPASFLPEPHGRSDELARRLWRLRREHMRSGFAALGVQVVEWQHGTPVDAALVGLSEARRWARFARR